MQIQEITLDRLDPARFIAEKSREFSTTVDNALAVNALSGGVDSSVVTALGHQALGGRLKTYFIDNGIMRKNEPGQIAEQFGKLGIPIEIIDAKAQFFAALKGLSDPEEKREAITQTFYKQVFGDLVKKSGARFYAARNHLYRRGRRARRKRRVLVPGHPARGQGHGHQERQTGLRQPDRSQMLGKQGRQDGHAQQARF